MEPKVNDGCSANALLRELASKLLRLRLGLHFRLRGDLGDVEGDGVLADGLREGIFVVRAQLEPRRHALLGALEAGPRRHAEASRGGHFGVHELDAVPGGEARHHARRRRRHLGQQRRPPVRASFAALRRRSRSMLVSTSDCPSITLPSMPIRSPAAARTIMPGVAFCGAIRRRVPSGSITVIERAFSDRRCSAAERACPRARPSR